MPDSHGAESRQSQQEHSIDESAYLFMTFLYAAAVHLVIAKAQEGLVAGLPFYLFVLTLVLFLFSDWASRSRLPRLLPEKPRGYMYVCKTSIEIICVFFLVSAFLLLVSGADVASPIGTTRLTPALAFGLFLVATGVWDYVMIYVMDALDFIPLAGAVFIRGNAIDMDKPRKTYLGRFDAWKQARETTILADASQVAAKIAADPEHSVELVFDGAGHAATRKFHLRLFEGALASLTQFLANHVLYANALAGGILVIEAVWLGRSPLDAVLKPQHLLFDSIPIGPVLSAAALSIPILVFMCLAFRRSVVFVSLGAIVGLFAVTTLFPQLAGLSRLGAIISLVFAASTFCYYWRYVKRQRVRARLSTVGGLVIAVMLVVLYVGLPPTLLMVLLATQQVLANIFLQLGVSRVQRPAGTAMITPLLTRDAPPAALAVVIIDEPLRQS